MAGMNALIVEPSMMQFESDAPESVRTCCTGVHNNKLGCRYMIRIGLMIGLTGLLMQYGRYGDATETPIPNIVIIVSDDQGYNDLGMLGNGIMTPALDRLAKEGTRLTQFYVAWPACTPSRAAFLTGRYPQRNGIYDMIRNEAPDYGHEYSEAEYAVSFERIGGMDEREIVLPAILSRVGYTSGIFGKWDLGSLQRYLPTARGFDDFYGFVNTGIDYFTHERYGVPSMYRNQQPTVEDRGVYCTELFGREAKRFLHAHAGRAPFFLYLPFNAPHGSSSLDPSIRSTVQAPQEFKELYPPVDEEYRTVEKYRYGGQARVVTKEARQRDYRAAVTCMDAVIGELLAILEAANVLDNTIILFFSDNGGASGADNSPLRGRKGQMWEGGIRVPCLIRWPNGDIPSGATCDAFLTSLELLPSLVRVSGVPPSDDTCLDGYDWWSTLRGETETPRKEMFWKGKDMCGARVGDWKWVSMPGSGNGLFDLTVDVHEDHDLSVERPDILHMVQERFQKWMHDMNNAEPRGPFRDF